MRRSDVLQRHHQRTRPISRQAQQGAVGIEFVFLFTIFFGVFYAILSYAFVTLMYQGLIQAAAEGARSAVKLDPASFTSSASYQTASTTLARTAALNALTWMPQNIRTRIANGGVTTSFATTNTSINTGSGVQVVPMTTLTVRVTYADYKSQPLLPLLDLPGLGTIPSVPTDLVGSSTVRLY